MATVGASAPMFFKVVVARTHTFLTNFDLIHFQNSSCVFLFIYKVFYIICNGMETQPFPGFHEFAHTSALHTKWCIILSELDSTVIVGISSITYIHDGPS